MGNENRKTCSKQSSGERLRALLNLAIMTCLGASIVYQVSVSVYNYHQFAKLDARIGNLENIMESISVERSSKFTANQTALDKNKVVREKRSTQPKPVSLQGLARRVIVIESRLLKYNRTVAERCLSRPFIGGRDGRDGRPGPPGRDGKDGKDGRDGRDGREGPQGPRGLAGPRGQVGKTGPVGPQGPTGSQGEKGQGLSGVKYVRWGRPTCSGDATVVYNGIMGGEHYNHIGGGVNYLCLPHNPKYDKYKHGGQSTGFVYGTEYEVNSYSGIPFRQNLHDHEAPCAVCYVRSRGSMLMMPARNDCPAGWTEEYHGYLMTSYHGHKNQKDFVCVDKDPEYVPGTNADKDGALLYHVEGQCGSLPCLPYVQYRELTCAVCTK